MSENLALLPFGPGEFLALGPRSWPKRAIGLGRYSGQGGQGIDRAAAVTTQSPEKLLTAEAMEERTEVPSSWFLEHARLGRVPHHRLGKYVQFQFDEVLACSRVRERVK